MTPIREELDIFAARTELRKIACGLGFGRSDIEELAIVVSELAWNILKHASCGSIDVQPTVDRVYGVGVRIVARDAGPPFADFTTALLDGHDGKGRIDPSTLLSRRGIGSGLGAISRLTDACRYNPVSGAKEIEVVRYRKRPAKRCP